MSGAPASLPVQAPAPPRAAASGPRARVLVVGTHCFTDSMEWHVVHALREIGCTTEFFAARSFGGIQSTLQKALQKGARLLLREPERLVEHRLLEAVERVQPQLILVILGSQLSPKSMALLRGRTAARIVCWCQDSMTTLGRQYLLGAGYDAVFVKDRYMQDLFARMLPSTPFHYLAEACNPAVHRTIELTERDRGLYGCDVMIAGTLYYFRQEILGALSAFDLKVYGHRPSWLLDRLPGRHTGRNVFGDDKVRAVRAARIALNTLHFSEVDGLNCRAFELAGCGAFQIVTARPVLAEHFKPGEEIECFSSIDELIDKTRFYLRNPERARRIAEAGQRRAHSEHTFAHRLEEILRIALSDRTKRRREA